MRECILSIASDVGRLFHRHFNAAAREQGITGPQWRFLLVVRRWPGINQRSASDWLEVDSMTASRMLDRLSKAGLVERRDDPADRRTWQLYLTDLAEQQLSKLAEFDDMILSLAMMGLDKNEQFFLTKLLAKIRDNLVGKKFIE